MCGSVDELKPRPRGRGWLHFAGALLLTTGLLLLGCGTDSGSSQNRPELTCDAQVPVVTANDVESQIMTPVCSSCHAPGGGGVGAPGQWETADKMFNNTVNKTSTYSSLPIVDPGNLSDSVMYLKVLGGSPTYKGPRGESVGGVMPQPPTAMLTSTQTALLKNWICGGARR